MTTITSSKTDEIAAQYYQMRDEQLRDNVPRLIGQKAMPITKVHGDCTLTDPRVCFRYKDGTADICCCLFVPISEVKWMAMIKNQMVMNKTNVCVAQVHTRSVFFAIAQNPVPADRFEYKDIGDIERRINNKCREGVDLLRPDFQYVYDQCWGWRRCDSDGQFRPMIYTMSWSEFQQYRRKAWENYECLRERRLNQKKGNAQFGPRRPAVVRRGGNNNNNTADTRLATGINVVPIPLIFTDRWFNTNNNRGMKSTLHSQSDRFPKWAQKQFIGGMGG